VADRGQPSRISRKHTSKSHYSGVDFVMGGKYTTYRAIAEEAVRKALPHLAGKIALPRPVRPLWQAAEVMKKNKILSERFNVSMELVRYLQGIYGSRFIDVLHITERDVLLKEKICSCSPAIAAQVVYAREVEMAQTVEDIIERRLELAYLECPIGACRRAIESILKKPSMTSVTKSIEKSHCPAS